MTSVGSSTSGIKHWLLYLSVYPSVRLCIRPPLYFPVLLRYNWHCCCSVAKLCLAVGHPVDYSTPGFPVLHCPPEFVQTHVHWNIVG